MIFNEEIQKTGIPELAQKLASQLNLQIEYCDVSDAGTIGIHFKNGITVLIYTRSEISKPYKDDLIYKLIDITVINGQARNKYRVTDCSFKDKFSEICSFIKSKI